MMDAVYILVLCAVGFFLVKNKLLPRLKKTGQEAVPEKEGGACVKNEMPDFRVLSFNTGDFTYKDDLANCVEFELGKAISELKKDGCLLVGDPFPIVAGSSILILLNYKQETVIEKMKEVK